MDTRLASTLALALLLAAPAARAQEAHTIRFESVDRALEVYAGARHLCRTPCERRFPGGARLRLGFSPPETRRARARHTERGLDLAALADFDVLAPRTLRVQWVEHRDLRIAGDVVLVAGVTLGALLGSTIIASYQGTGDDGLFALGIVGAVIMGLSLAIGIPLAVFEDEVREVDAEPATGPTPR